MGLIKPFAPYTAKLASGENLLEVCIINDDPENEWILDKAF